VSDVSITPNPVPFADADFGSASNAEESQLTDVAQPPRYDLTRGKLCSENFRLPEGMNVLHFIPVPWGA